MGISDSDLVNFGSDVSIHYPSKLKGLQDPIHNLGVNTDIVSRWSQCFRRDAFLETVHEMSSYHNIESFLLSG